MPRRLIRLVIGLVNLTLAELKAKAAEALQTDSFTDIDVRRTGKDGTVYVGRGHAGEEVILIFVRGSKR